MLHLQFDLDQPLVPIGSPTTRHVILRISAEREGREAPDRRPLHLAIVIDASGSMLGERLAAAQRAASKLVQHLEEGDRLTLISFGEDVRIHLEGARVTQGLRERATTAISRITTRGSTYLSGGWLTAGQLLAHAPDVEAPRRRHVLLLSDGKANRGIKDPELLAQEARALQAAGVTTTAVGIGDDYSSRQLAAIAENGGGRLHDAAMGAEIEEVVLGEIGELDGIVAEDIELQMELPLGVMAEPLAGLPHLQQGRNLTCPLGSMHGGGRRELVIRLEIPQLAADSISQLTTRLRWRSVEDLEARFVEHTHDIEVADARSEPPHLEDALIVLRHWQAGLVRSATQMSRDRDHDGVMRLREEILPRFVAYAEWHEQTRNLPRQVDRLLRRCSRPMGGRQRKHLFVASSKAVKGEREHRGGHQRTWQDYLFED